MASCQSCFFSIGGRNLPWLSFSIRRWSHQCHCNRCFRALGNWQRCRSRSSPRFPNGCMNYGHPHGLWYHHGPPHDGVLVVSAAILDHDDVQLFPCWHLWFSVVLQGHVDVCDPSCFIFLIKAFLSLLFLLVILSK